MADEKLDSLALVGRHVPDVSLELGPDGNKISEPLPGVYEVGVEVGGRFMPLATFKAGNLVDKDNKVQTGGSTSSESRSDSDDSSSEYEQKSE